MAVNKIKRGRAIIALTKAGMAHSTAERYVRMLDLDKPLAPQIAELAEDMADLFGDATDETDDDAERPMTAREAQRARLSGGHRLTPARPDRPTPAERNAAALGAGRPRQVRPSAAPATAQAAADRLRQGLGNAVDGPSS